MFNDVQGLLQRVTTGDIDRPSISQAASEQVSQMDETGLAQHLHTAAGNAEQNGQSGVAQQITGLLSRGQSNPGALKQEAISLITSNPQILQHFEPGFAKAVLARI